MTGVALADLIGVSRQAIYGYEHERLSPHPAVLDRICNTLNLPHQFFRFESAELPAGPVFYRSLASATKTARLRAERRLQWLQEIVVFLESHLELPDLDLPSLVPSQSFAVLTDVDIELAARMTRRHWNLGDGPLSNLTGLLENHGVIVTVDDLGAATLDSLSTFPVRDSRPFIVLSEDKGTAVRWRFDLAHELAHLLLHRSLDLDEIRRSENYRLIEEQAHHFAGAFLLPPEQFAEELDGVSLEDFTLLKRRWRVSVGTMIKSARRLGLVSEERERRLWMGYSRRGWRKEEPLDSEIPFEHPQLLRRSLELLLNEGMTSTHDLVSQLHISESDIERLATLRPGDLQRLSDLAATPELRTRRHDRGGDVIHFPARPRD